MIDVSTIYSHFILMIHQQNFFWLISAGTTVLSCCRAATELHLAKRAAAELTWALSILSSWCLIHLLALTGLACKLILWFFEFLQKPILSAFLSYPCSAGSVQVSIFSVLRTVK